MNVVSLAESGERGICQNPELASSLLRTVAPASCASTWSTAGKGCLSRRTLWLSLVRSTQIRTLPSDFGTTTIPEHQSVGSWIFEITPTIESPFVPALA